MGKQLLQVGDIIKLNGGMRVYAFIPDKFIVSNRKASNNLCKTDLLVGQVFKNSGNLDIFRYELHKEITRIFSEQEYPITDSAISNFLKENVKDMQAEIFSIPEGEYLVIHTSYGGGGHGHGPTDIYPDGHFVKCSRLIDGEYNSEAVQVSFYQTGCFTAMIRDIEPIRQMELTFK